MDPSDGWSTTSAFLIRRWPGTVLGFAASPKDLVCWNVFCESGNMTKQSKSETRIEKRKKAKGRKGKKKTLVLLSKKLVTLLQK